MRTKLWFAVLAVAILTAFIALPLAGAEKTVQEKGRQCITSSRRKQCRWAMYQATW